MKKLLTASAVFATASGSVPALAQSFEWISQSPGNDMYDAVAAMPNGDVVVVGEADSDIEFDTLGLVRRIDASGTVLWEQSFDFGGWDRLKAVAALPDGDLVVAGVVETETRESYGWVIRLAADGTALWNRTYAASAGGNSGFTDLDIGPDGTLLLAGYGGVDAGGQPDVWVARLDDTGTMLWEDSFDSSGWDEAAAVLAMDDGSIAIAGVTASLDPEKAGLVAMLDPTGQVAWTQPIGKGRNISFWDIAQLPDGTLVVAGAGNDDEGVRAGLVVGLSPAGEPLWHNFLLGSGRSAFLSLVVNAQGDMMAAGWSTTGDGDLDGWAVALDNEGGATEDWQFGGTDSDRITDVGYTPQNGWAAVGVLTSADTATEDGWIVGLEQPRTSWLFGR